MASSRGRMVSVPSMILNNVIMSSPLLLKIIICIGQFLNLEPVYCNCQCSSKSWALSEIHQFKSRSRSSRIRTLLYTHTDILIANHLMLITWINYRFQALICSSTFALKLTTIDLPFPLRDQEIQEKLYLWKCQSKFIAKYLVMQARQLQLATAPTEVRNRISVILFPKDRQK